MGGKMNIKIKKIK